MLFAGFAKYYSFLKVATKDLGWVSLDSLSHVFCIESIAMTKDCGFLIRNMSTSELAVESATSKAMDLMGLMFPKGNSG